MFRARKSSNNAVSDTATSKGAETVRAFPFIKWAGGKRAVVRELLKHVPVDFRNYYEPFVGGGALYFALVDRIHKQAFLSDANVHLIKTYIAIRDHVEELIVKLQYHAQRHSKSYYDRIRGKQFSGGGKVETAAEFIYLNRTCFNGLFRVNKAGKFNVPMGNYKNPIICDETNLRKASVTLQKTKIFYRDFKQVRPQAGDFIYCDPPYDATFNSYTSMKFNLQEILAKQATKWSEKGTRVVISNSDNEKIRTLYSGKQWKIYEIIAPRVISCKPSSRKAIGELLIVSE